MTRFAILCLIFFAAGCASLKTRDAEIIREVAPAYPEDARQQGIEGRVVIEFTISDEGVPEEYQIVEATLPGVFEAEAIAALRQWRYEPARRMGRAVESPEAEAVFVFNITDGETDTRVQ